MRSTTRPLLFLCLPALMAATQVTAALAGNVERVTLTVPMPSQLDMRGIDTILITRFIIDREEDEVDLNRELIPLLRRGLYKRTNLEILDVDPPSLPEQPLRDLLANNGFWRRMGSTYGADLIISGKVSFDVSDRSGFVTRDVISPVTGQRIRRTVYVDREGLTLWLNLFFIRGSTGALLYEDHFMGDDTVPLGGMDELTGLFSLFEQFEDDIMGILVTRARTVQRYLFTE